jgi:hypothetical protein
MSVLAFNESRHISSTARYAQQLYGSVSPGVRGFSHRLGQQLPLAAGGFEASGRRLVQLAGARWACARFWIDYRKKLTIECHTLLNNG